MKQIEEFVGTKLLLLTGIIITLGACSHDGIEETDDSLIFRDVVGNKLEIRGEDTGKIKDVLSERNIMKNGKYNSEVWIYIDRNFYQEYEYYHVDEEEGKIDDDAVFSDSLVIVQFSKHHPSKEELISEYRKSNVTLYTKMWYFGFTYDEGRDKLLRLEYQF